MTRNEKALIRMIDVQLMLREGELSKAEISRQLGVNYETVRRHISDYNTDPAHKRVALRDALLWVGIQVERKDLDIIDGQIKIDRILDLIYDDAEEIL